MDKIIILENKRFKIDKPKLTIGRGKDSDIVLNDDKVSRLHGIIHSSGNDIFYEDLDSSNGSFINNKPITGKRKIKVGDIIQVREKSQKKTAVTDALETVVRRGVPSWMEIDKDAFKGTLKALPNREDLTMPIQEQLIVELYSK